MVTLRHEEEYTEFFALRKVFALSKCMAEACSISFLGACPEQSVQRICNLLSILERNDRILYKPQIPPKTTDNTGYLQRNNVNLST